MPSASIQNTTPFTTYSMTVQAKNIMGVGKKSGVVTAQFNYNKGTGGVYTEFTTTEQNVTDAPDVFGGAGEQWAVHTFSSTSLYDPDVDGTGFVVERNVREWRVVVIGGGGGRKQSNGCDSHCCGETYGGAPGYSHNLDDDNLGLGPYSITVGGGGGGGGGCGVGGTGGTSKLVSVDSTYEQIHGGGTGGGNTCCCACCNLRGCPVGGTGGSAFWSNINGTNTRYGAHPNKGAAGPNETNAGKAGGVIISYRIG